MRSPAATPINPRWRAAAASVAAHAPPAVAPACLAAAASPAVSPAAPPPGILDVAVEAGDHAVMGRHRHGLGGRRDRREDERRERGGDCGFRHREILPLGAYAKALSTAQNGELSHSRSRRERRRSAAAEICSPPPTAPSAPRSLPRA